MLSVQEARERILSQVKISETESVALGEALSRVLADNILADGDYPPFDNSAVDGFALRMEDSGSNRALTVVADIPAGSVPTVKLKAGQAARIMTGAQVPLGADCIVPVEETDFKDRNAGTAPPKTIGTTKKMRPGENIRQRGMDMNAGDTVLEKGRALKPQDLGLLATLGFAKVNVHKKPQVALMSSGDELLEAGAALQPGKIRDSNSYSLAASIIKAGGEVLRLGVARDTRDSVTALLDKAVEEKADLILSSAGVSVGAFDFIKEVIETSGTMDFWKVNMRPGQPLAFGEYRGIPFVGLPGNPVSAFVGFEVFVRPTLQRMSGSMDGDRQRIKVRCAEEVESDGRESYLRARLRLVNGVQSAFLTGHQGSGNLLSLVQADALLIIPAGVKCVPAGSEVDAILI
jgi:molybdopterin molybdotransferase